MPSIESPVRGSKSSEIREYLRAHPDAQTKDVSRRFGVPEASVRRLRSHKGAAAKERHTANVSLEIGPEEAVASSRSTQIKTLDQLLAATEVDLSVWEVERHVINKWEVAMREPATTVGGAGNDAKVVTNETGGEHTLWTRGSNVPLHEELFQIKIWLKRKAPRVLGIRAMLEDMIERANKAAPPPRKIHYTKRLGECLAEIDQPDLHLGKLCWAAESGESFDVDIAEKVFMEGIARHRDAAALYNVGRFLLPIGNDYLNVDNALGTTTGGTKQDEDGRWQRSYIRGRALLERAIDYLREVAPVDVIQVGGNHDFERGFYLADALACIYRNQRDVTIDNRPTVRKYYAWGNSLIGFTHGDKEAVKDLPLTMAVEAPQQWAKAKFREFHCGHVHHQREKVFQPILEDKGVVVRHLSSLTAADAWHAGKGYRAQRASSCFVRHPEQGIIAELRFSL
jgi:hypothetical protein